MNYTAIVGRLTKDPQIKTTEEGITRTIVTLAVSRDYRSQDNSYETDFIPCVLWNGLASATKDYCHKGDVIGIKGRLQSRTYKSNEETKYVLEFVADKVTFISSASKKSTPAL